MNREEELKKIIEDIEQQDVNLKTLQVVNLICNSHENCCSCKYWDDTNCCPFTSMTAQEIREYLCLK